MHLVPSLGEIDGTHELGGYFLVPTRRLSTLFYLLTLPGVVDFSAVELVGIFHSPKLLAHVPVFGVERNSFTPDRRVKG